ncbi:MAG TPA: hypothetical protein VHA52_08645 [Candidatus Babeliaceae bacterium]|jgi:hypothetical protein|nr:hypothetical protein [Candidatus Babeliaceae bacterium]
MTLTSRYPDFDYDAVELAKFIAAGNIITIMTKKNEIIHHTANDPQNFVQWLKDNGVEDIRQSDGHNR